MILLVLFALLYLAAKTHFFLRFDAHNIGAYVTEHSRFWLSMAGVGALLYLIELTTRDG